MSETASTSADSPSAQLQQDAAVNSPQSTSPDAITSVVSSEAIAESTATTHLMDVDPSVSNVDSTTNGEKSTAVQPTVIPGLGMLDERTEQNLEAVTPSESTKSTMDSQPPPPLPPAQAPIASIQTPARKIPEPLTLTNTAAIAAKRTPALKSSTSRSPAISARASAKRKSTSRSKKRKSANGSTSSDESDEEFTMEGMKTKSGRKVHRPSQYDPAIKTPTRKRPPAKKIIIDTKICKICQRGHSPQSNMIVFCDGCNTPYHQLCHDPPIDEIVIQVPEAEWFCAPCSATRGKKEVETGLPGTSLTSEEKRTYLSSLSQSQLIELVFFCEKHHPSIPLYNPNTKRIVQEYRNRAQELAALDAMHAQAAADYVLTMDDMVIIALDSINDPKGSPPKVIYEWLSTNYPSLEGRDIRAEATPVLQRLLKSHRLLRDHHNYRLNPNWVDPLAPVAHHLPAALDTIPNTPNKPGSTTFRGIKLPPEGEDEAWLVEAAPHPGFSHVWAAKISNGHQVNGIVGGGMDLMGDDEDAEGVEDD